MAATPPSAETFIAGTAYGSASDVPVDCGCSQPSELQKGSVRRVRIAALGFAAVWLVVLVMNNLFFRLVAQLPGVHDGWPLPGNYFASAGLLSALAMAEYARRTRHHCDRILDLGLVFLVFSAGIVGVMNFWGTQTHGGRISWITAMVLFYPAIAPTTPAKTLVSGLAAASMDIVGLGVGWWRGLEYGLTPFEFAWLLLPNYICAVLAVIPARLIRSLGHQVTAARELGSYRLDRLLGKGGMGEVHAASHRMIARPAAVKFIRPELLAAGTPGFAGIVAERFRREAEAAAALRSPHTIELYDFGIADPGIPYYVMELLDGIDAQSLVERFGPLPPERVIHLLRQVCDSLAEAHDKGMIHRDIKPSNIFVCRQGLTTDYVKVLDFGLVKRAPSAGHQDVELTGIGTGATGTPAYAAPEVALAEGPTDRRADIYAVGCVGYWLLTGRPVFEAPGPIQMLYKHAHETPSPPSRAAAHPVPEALDTVILDCLAKAPVERPQNAEDLAAMLCTVPVPEPWTQARSRAWWDANLGGSVDGAARPSPGFQAAV